METPVFFIYKKTNKDLEDELIKYKLDKTEDYEKFIQAMKTGIANIPIESENETKVKTIISEVLESALKYDSKSRTTLQNIMENMRKFDLVQGIKLEYNTIEKVAQEKLNRMLGLQDFIDEQEEKINKIVEESKKAQDESGDLESKVKSIKEEVSELEKQKLSMEIEIKKDKSDLNFITHQLENIKEKDVLEKENKELEEQLEEVQGKIAKLEKEVFEQTIANESLFKRCEKYTELQIKYANDTMILFDEKEKLTKKLQESMKNRPPHP